MALAPNKVGVVLKYLIPMHNLVVNVVLDRYVTSSTRTWIHRHDNERFIVFSMRYFALLRIGDKVHSKEVCLTGD